MEDKLNQIDQMMKISMRDGWNRIKPVLHRDSLEEFDVIKGLRQMRKAASMQSDASKIKDIEKRIGFGVHGKSKFVCIDRLPLNNGGADLLCQAILKIVSSDNRASLSDEGKAVGGQEDRSNYKQEEPEALDEQSQEELQNAINDYSSSRPLAPLSIPNIKIAAEQSNSGSYNLNIRNCFATIKDERADWFQQKLDKSSEQEREEIENEMSTVRSIAVNAWYELLKQRVLLTQNPTHIEGEKNIEVNKSALGKERGGDDYPFGRNPLVKQKPQDLSEEINLTGNDNNQQADVEALGENTTDMHSID